MPRMTNIIACVFTGTLSIAPAADPAAETPAGIVVRTSGGTQPYWVEQLADGLNFPSSMAWLPNGDILITERIGDLRVLRSGRLDAAPIRGTPPVFHNSLGDGLKDILLDPDFIENQWLYLLISEGTFDKRYAAVYRARYSGAGLEELKCIFRSRHGEAVMENGTMGSRMLFLIDKTLLVAVGSPEDHKQQAQDLNSHSGKILRIHRDGSVPLDNPFVNTPGTLPEIWSYGHRVVMGLYQEPKTGAVWAVESGPRGGDELNVLKAGGNFGWSKVGWGFKYNNTGAQGSEQSAKGSEDPILIWTPSVTPAGLVQYWGDTYRQWNGDYFIGHLTTKELERLRFQGHRLTLQERMLLDLEERIRDVRIGPDNYLYLLTDHQNGRVLRLRPGQPSADQLARVAHKLQKSWDIADTGKLIDIPLGDPVRGHQEFLARCAACHSVGTVIRGGQIGPDLSNVFGRQAGRVTGFAYSPSLLEKNFKWDFSMLYYFLADPSGVVPGTKMAAPPVVDSEVLRQIIGFLKRESSQ